MTKPSHYIDAKFLNTKINNNALSDKLKYLKLSLKCKPGKQIWRPTTTRIVAGNYIILVCASICYRMFEHLNFFSAPSHFW